MSMKKGILICVCCLLALAIGLAAFMTVSILRGPQTMGGIFGMELKLVNRQELSASQVERLVVSYGSEHVELLEGDSPDIVLEEYMSRWDEDMSARITREGGTLEIRQGKRNVGLFNFFRGHIKVYLPRSYRGALEAGSSSGSVESPGSFTLSQAKLTSSSGSVRVGTIISAGPVELEATSGSVHAGRIEAEGAFSARSSSGSLHLGEVTAAAADLRSTSGSVHLESGTVQGRFSAESSSGSLHLEDITASDAAMQTTSGSVNVTRVQADTLTAKSSSGGVRLAEAYGQMQCQATSGSVRVAGSGCGSFTSSSGGVEVRLSEVTGDIEANSTSGSIRLEIPRDLSFRFAAETTSGGIHTDFDEALSFTRRGNSASGDVGQNPQVKVDCSASSGSVRVSLQ